MSKKLTTEEFIEKAKIVHKNRYDYSKVIYTNNHTKVCIICPKHDEFFQQPNDHLNGSGCPKCWVRKLPKTTKMFIKNAKEIHGNEYNYSKVNYCNARTKVCIVCSIHGEFLQIPITHTRGSGCPKCGLIKISKYFSLNNEKFIKKANKVHNNKYDYSKVNYCNAKTKVCIICPKHGEFFQNAGNHLHGYNCPKCNSSNGEERIERYLKEQNIKYITQKRFDDCRNKLKLPFDFYLPEIKTCIEFNGQQHYESIKYWGGDSTLEYVQRNDKIKRNYCKTNNIRLIEIPYTEDIILILEEKVCI